jgi:hypothetical protein
MPRETIMNSMGRSPSSEYTGYSVAQPFVESKGSIHKSLPLVPIMTQMNPVQTFIPYLRSILILYSHPRIGLPRGLFPLGLPAKILNVFVSQCVHHSLNLTFKIEICNKFEQEGQLPYRNCCNNTVFGSENVCFHQD